MDSQATITKGKHCVLYVWYDNEYGYTCQLVRIIFDMAGLKLKDYPKQEKDMKVLENVGL